MHLHYHRIQQENDPLLAFIKALYQSAFPEPERREWDSFTALLTDLDMHVDVVFDDGQAIGFLIWWKLKNWLFVEHFAISTAVRGGGFGSAVIKHYVEKAQGKVILEVEPATSPETGRRIAFYERLGFNLVDIPYRQPSYVEKGLSFPMCLMQTGAENEEEIARLLPEIKSTVYFR